MQATVGDRVSLSATRSAQSDWVFIRVPDLREITDVGRDRAIPAFRRSRRVRTSLGSCVALVSHKELPLPPLRSNRRCGPSSGASAEQVYNRPPASLMTSYNSRPSSDSRLRSSSKATFFPRLRACVSRDGQAKGLTYSFSHVWCVGARAGYAKACERSDGDRSLTRTANLTRGAAKGSLVARQQLCDKVSPTGLSHAHATG